MTVRPLTKRDIEVLRELEAANRSPEGLGHRDGWAAPMDCGGSNGSHHGETLRKLYARGLTDRKSWTGQRRTNWYKINDAGRQALHEDYLVRSAREIG